MEPFINDIILELNSGQLLQPGDKDQKKKIKKKRSSSSRRKSKAKLEDLGNIASENVCHIEESKENKKETSNADEIPNRLAENEDKKETQEKENNEKDGLYEETITTSVFDSFQFAENKDMVGALTVTEDIEHENTIGKERTPLTTVKKTIKSRTQVLREDKTSRILAPILRQWNGKPSALDKVKASVKTIKENQANNTRRNLPKLASQQAKKPNLASSKRPEHFWDEGNLKESENSTFTGFRL